MERLVLPLGTLALGVGYAFLGAFVLTLLYAFLNKPIAWRDMFSEAPGEPQHVSRYAVFLGTVWLAARFLSGVLAQPHISRCPPRSATLVRQNCLSLSSDQHASSPRQPKV